MKSRDLVFIAIVIFVVGGLYYLSTKNKAKPMPNTPAHQNVVTRQDCFQCHVQAKFAEMERQHKHPGKWRDERVSCLLCHATPKTVKAQSKTMRALELMASLQRRAQSAFKTN